MLSKITREVSRGTYVRENALTAKCPVYRNVTRGWVNYLIGDTITFSHRRNDYANYTYPDTFEMHDYYELIIYPSGEDLQYIADGEYFTVPQGAALLIKPYTMHILRMPTPQACERYVINFRSPEALFPDHAALEFLGHGNAHYALFTPDTAILHECAAIIERELQQESSPYQNAYALMRLTELFITLSQCRSASADKLKEPNAVSAVPSNILEVKEYIDREYLHIRSVAELTDRFHYNRDYLSRSFHRYFNTPVYEYILRRRLMHSCILLISGESVDGAAKQSGFTNRINYAKLFRRHLGCTPTEYVAKSKS